MWRWVMPRGVIPGKWERLGSKAFSNGERSAGLAAHEVRLTAHELRGAVSGVDRSRSLDCSRAS